jgi:tRNA1Val (adenine37-N6)-methyltransferase
MPRVPAPFFRFKQFTVWHDRSSLKVCTEACILGAYTNVRGSQRALDIGTGTGLLALMIAQRNASMAIEAIEIEKQNFEQATENVAQSRFSAQIRVYQGAIQDWKKSQSAHQHLLETEKYDLIVSNPPFFDKHLLSKREERNRALHTETLSLPDLAASVVRLLAAEGRFVVLLPPYQTQILTELLAAYGLWPTHQLQIFRRESKPIFRQITTFEASKKTTASENLYIHDDDGKYSDGFRTLLKEYYIIF